MSRREKVFAVLPTMLTLGNAVCGFGAITFAAKWSSGDSTLSLFIASCLIYLAMVFDALDGSAARLTKQTSEFGAQLDSLCDAISFGAAPAFLMLQFSHSKDLLLLRFVWLIAALYVVCAVLRLARFNVETDEDDAHDSFSGLPSPAAAGTVASFPIMAFGFRHLEDAANDKLWEHVATWLDTWTPSVLPFITLAVACLMVSRIRYAHLVNRLIRGRRPRQHLIQIVFALAVMFVMPQVSVPLFCCWFAFGAPLRALWNESVMRWWHRGHLQPIAATASPSTGVAWKPEAPTTNDSHGDHDDMDDA
ncbi:MAG: CDP-diacylglycerol--serine O-phosphatidyltransferase [Planctomycetota bacterium]|nr:MAG: CDP-diacylglycerol--serine O-phosphatidyltransferase [Planctomycetota bacterium]GDY10277.1 CDP-diacylglycerol--serine O-phosphatidyltransferase [Planctomycetia bacterium]